MADPSKAVPPEPSTEIRSDSPLNFDEAQPIDSETQQKSCITCLKSPLDTYYVAAGDVVCSDCATILAERKPPEPGLRGLMRAFVYGAGAAILGTVIYYAVRAITGYEIGWIAVIVGWLVGRAVRKGGNQYGGWKLQTMAVVLTYCSIIGSYVPLIIKAAIDQQQKVAAAKKEAGAVPVATPQPQSAAKTPDPAAPLTTGGAILALVMFALLMLAIPFLAGFENVLGILIIGIGLLEAWRLNRRPNLMPAGPFFVKAAESE